MPKRIQENYHKSRENVARFERAGDNSRWYVDERDQRPSKGKKSSGKIPKGWAKYQKAKSARKKRQQKYRNERNGIFEYMHILKNIDDFLGGWQRRFSFDKKVPIHVLPSGKAAVVENPSSEYALDVCPFRIERSKYDPEMFVVYKESVGVISIGSDKDSMVEIGTGSMTIISLDGEAVLPDVRDLTLKETADLIFEHQETYRLILPPSEYGSYDENCQSIMPNDSPLTKKFITDKENERKNSKLRTWRDWFRR